MHVVIKGVRIDQRPDYSIDPVIDGNKRISMHAVATLYFYCHRTRDGDAVVQEISSGGLFGIEVAADRDQADHGFLAEVEAEQRSELGEMLAALGLSHKDAPV